ncbi:DUF4199 domain-containing protein [Rufibacter glacialis]|uniref:DUF4199 domain-containing protein n=1 Tax=Rufibacter glacialis TaxID=1259555 RepID=A0A5M8QPP7_9BACT|nr:DUF4199 domain-containing protein [Rufibacter glacialis]KAA6438049.1 DUF4199 domain-containing protein [Rufibacter glacialis]GGK89528.1 hypothetical protein GCM10011405_41540 [Rufibacter glacialis]
MNEQTVSPGSVGVRYGIITGFVSIIYSLILYMTGLHLNKGLSYLGTVIPIVGIIMAYLYYKKENGGFMSYGQGLGTGTILAAVSGVLSGTFTYIYLKFIDGNILEQIRNASIEEMENKGMSDEQIEQAASMTEKFTTPEMMLIMGVVGAVLLGFILSLLIAAVMKRNRPEFE